MTVEFVKPDGTHVRVNDEIAGEMPGDWERLDHLTDSTAGFVSVSKIEGDGTEVKSKPRTVAKQK